MVIILLYMDRVGRSCFLAIVDVLVYIEKAQLSELPVLESHASRCYVHKQPMQGANIYNI